MATAKNQSTDKPAFQRQPPQNIEAEQAVLGAMLLEAEAVSTTLEILHGNPEDLFYVGSHQHIFEAMVNLFRKSQPIEATTVVGELSVTGKLEAAGGAAYIAKLVGIVPTAANVEYYAKNVLDMAVLRRLISSCTEIATRAYGCDSGVDTLLDNAESTIFSLAEQRQVNPVHRIPDLLDTGIENIEKLMKSRTGMTGLGTGIHDLDRLLSGMQPSDMIVLAARPSVGKTAFALNIAAHVANRLEKSALVFSLEMSKEQLVQRLLCLEGEVNARRLREGFMAGDEFQKVQKAADTLSRAKLYVDDTPSISVLELRSKARRIASAYTVDLIIIDYLQLMRGHGQDSRRGFENRQVEIAEISRSVKAIARELSVPVLTLCQLNREAEKDDTGTPKLAHLRESGAIEQDADVVLILARPPLEERRDNPDLIHVHVSKQRNGPTGFVKVLFEKETQRVRNLDDRVSAPAESASFSPDLDNVDDDMAEDDIPY
ncbi:MAG: replicative DNA helicase [Candidatus Hydrogenedentota bacterium]